MSKPFTIAVIDEAAVAAVMVGVNGWHRWGSWAAHWFDDGKQLCHHSHTFAAGGMARGLPPQRPQQVELSRWGVPYGRVCVMCTKLLKQRKGER